MGHNFCYDMIEERDLRNFPHKGEDYGSQKNINFENLSDTQRLFVCGKTVKANGYPCNFATRL